MVMTIGSPLRMRGKDFPFFPFVKLVRITPAYAGKRTGLPLSSCNVQDHPCVCGEKVLDIIGFLHIWGSPLRMRGKAQTQLSFTVPKRITPAYAGKRMMMEILTATVRDHPCVCGEKSPRSHSHLRDPGSPLRMRGKVQQAGRVHIRRRITPAYAGKSWLPAKRALSLGDHPCVCGEKATI